MSLVSIIMPAYNAAEYISEAIESVLAQSHEDWELLVINDGSQDETEEKVLAFEDSRIRYFVQENKGVSAARNVGLDKMKGDFFCFLDADDVLPQNSIRARYLVFKKDSAIFFVSGRVVQKDEHLTKVLSSQMPTWRGNPRREIIRLSSSCLVAITWLIRRDCRQTYRFQEGWTHSEDVAFFLSISEKGLFDYTEEEVLFYRRNGGSAMSNLKGLEESYIKYYKYVKKVVPDVNPKDYRYLKFRIMRIMFLSYLAARKPWASIKAVFKIFFL